MSNGINPVGGSALPVSARDKISVPVNVEQEILKLCVELRPGKQFFTQQFKTSLKNFFADGKLDINEFAVLLGLDRTGGVKKKFWLLFTGGKETIATQEEFLSALRHCRESLEMTGDTLVSIAKSENIIPVSREKLGKMLQGMGLNAQHLNTNPYLGKPLELAKALGGDAGKEGFENLNQKTWELLAFRLYSDFVISGAWKELGYDDIDELDLSDSWVLERFGISFEKYVKENQPPSKEELGALIKFQKRVEDFRKWCEEKGMKNQIGLLEIDPNASENGKYLLDEILGNYKDIYKKSGREGLIQELKSRCRKGISIPVKGKISFNPAAYQLGVRLS